MAAAVSFNEYKTITCGDGGMVLTQDEALYRRCFAFHDQGHSPLRLGIEVGKRPFLGLNARRAGLNALSTLKANELVGHHGDKEQGEIGHRVAQPAGIHPDRPAPGLVHALEQLG